MIEAGQGIGKISIEKFRSWDDYMAGKPYDVVEGHNMFLTVGSNELWSLAIGSSSDHFTNSNTTIGVGDDSTAPNISQTDLLASTNKFYQGMETGYPDTPSARTINFRSVFGSSDANFVWNELVVKQSVSGICINRATDNWGTKIAGDVWTVTATLSIL